MLNINEAWEHPQWSAIEGPRKEIEEFVNYLSLISISCYKTSDAEKDNSYEHLEYFYYSRDATFSTGDITNICLWIRKNKDVEYIVYDFNQFYLGENLES